MVCRDRSAFYVDLRSAFERRAVWRDGEDPLIIGARAIAEEFGPVARLGIEMGAWHLSAARFAALRAALPGTVFEDVGDLVARQRLVKSPAELAYQRRAGEAAEAGMTAGVAAARAGARERDVAAAVCAAMVRAGSDDPGPGVLSSGSRARHLHGGYGDRVLAEGDTLQLEVTPHVRQYHARFMRTLKIGRTTTAERDKAARLIAVQNEALAAVGPGVPAAVPDRIYREGIVATGPDGRLPQQDVLFRRPHHAPSGRRALGGDPRLHLDLPPGHGLPHLSAGGRIRLLRDHRHHGHRS